MGDRTGPLPAVLPYRKLGVRTNARPCLDRSTSPRPHRAGCAAQRRGGLRPLLDDCLPEDGLEFQPATVVEWAVRLQKPVLVFEPLRCGYRWASDRFQRFVTQGMVDNAQRLQRRGVAYYPYVEPSPGAGKGLLAELAGRASVVVSDDFPCFFLPRMMAAAAAQIPGRFELIDSNGLLPMRAAEKVFQRAYDFRRFLQKTLRPHLDQSPQPDPLSRVRLPSLVALPAKACRKWPPAPVETFADRTDWLERLPIDHQVGVAAARGGSRAAVTALRRFLAGRLSRYESERNQPEEEVTSGLSPYLHFGHLSPHQVFAEVTEHEDWTADRIAAKGNGIAQGWWGASATAEAFLDQLITWRELGFNLCWQRTDHDQYESLPDWVQRTLQKHARDPREHVYSLEQFEASETHDELWNAAQRQLVTEGRIHNYLRMLWGKKILEWTAHPRDALEIMIELNNKYALDGRDPNSYSGIFWCLGRYDRPWAPERPIFGQIRYMSSANTARKVRVRSYVRKYLGREDRDRVGVPPLGGRK